MAVKFGRSDYLVGAYLPELNAYLQSLVLTDAAGAPYSAAAPLPVALTDTAFDATGEATLAVTTTSARVALGSGGPTAFVVNTGANTAYIRFGNASVVADATLGHPVPPGWGFSFDIGTGTYLAAITASSTASLLISTGVGNPGVGSSALTTVSVATTTSDAVVTGGVGLLARSLGYVFNGTTWERLRSGGVTGMVGVNAQATTTGGASFLNIAAGQATTTVKSGAGTLYALVLNSAATATNTTTIYDNTAASGTVIGRPAVTTATVPTTLTYGGDVGLAFATGLTIITATANGGDMTVVYK